MDMTTLGAAIALAKKISATVDVDAAIAAKNAAEAALENAEDAQDAAENAQRAAETAAIIAASHSMGVSISGTTIIFASIS